MCADGEGVAALAACFSRSNLVSLNASNQTCSYFEDDCIKIFEQLSTAIKLKVVEENGVPKPASCGLPSVPLAFSCVLTNLGGCPGEIRVKVCICSTFSRCTILITLALACTCTCRGTWKESAQSHGCNGLLADEPCSSHSARRTPHRVLLERTT